MNRWIRRGLWGAAGVVALAAGAVGTGVFLADEKMNRIVSVDAAPLAVAHDAATLERGRYLYTSRGCADCHAADGGGRTFVDDGKGLKLAGPDITPAGAVAGYRPEDWVRTLRHGVKPGGKPLMIMPSEEFNRWTDADLGAVIAYVQSLPAAGGQRAVLDLPVPVRALYGFGLVKDAAEKIDHTLPPPQPVAEGVTIEHGRYVANMCIGCHGRQLAGGRIPGGPPDWPAAADLRPGSSSAMGRYPSADAMLAMFKSGQRPDGTPLQVMPFEALREMNEVDARALHLYLSNLPQGSVTAQAPSARGG
jgi:mono/diheme cytochrome c family protein